MDNLFNTAPTDGTPILAWHKVWKCWMTIRYRDNKTGGFLNCDWIDGTLSICWPTEAFSHWQNCPDDPTRI